MKTLFYLSTMNETKTQTMNETKRIYFDKYSVTITQMPLNEEGRKLGYKEQYRKVKTWHNFTGKMSGVVETKDYWKNDSERKTFNTTTKRKPSRFV